MKSLESIAVGLLAICGAAMSETPDVSYEVIYQTQNSPITSQRLEVLRDAESFARAWRELGGEEPPPAVDFERQMVVLAATGERPNTCYRVEIGGIERTASGLAVEVIDVVPGEDCMCGMMIVHPALAARLERHDGPVSFEVVSRARDCT
ncbi:MAG: hypothetical protein D6696_20515 [Acidobacteria bacterium]|nr:MAG: hypothetical protein D6696_20515 [Acidobacteriota bacterium]